MSSAETKHTPGPWKWHWRFEDGIATGSVFAEPREGHAYAVAMTPRYQTKERWEADASLIAAAPEMLAVLNAARIMLKNRDQRPEEMKLLDAIKIVVAKAEGHSVSSGERSDG